jgi:hypothetical protein
MVAFLYGTMLAMAQDRMIVKPGDDVRAAERAVALLTKYAVRFDPVDRITFYSGIIRRLAPIRAELAAQMRGDDERPR